jgi:acylpyruvate hydrolase
MWTTQKVSILRRCPKFTFLFCSQLELNNKVPAKPLFFLKPTTSYVLQGHPIIKPNACQVLHHEVELAVVIKGYVESELSSGLKLNFSRARKIEEKDAMNYVAGYTVALDMTARDIQDNSIKNGLPWYGS